MDKLGVIKPVDILTVWVSSLAYSWKGNSEVSICLSLRDLNEELCYSHHTDMSLHNPASQKIDTH